MCEQKGDTNIQSIWNEQKKKREYKWLQKVYPNSPHRSHNYVKEVKRLHSQNRIHIPISKTNEYGIELNKYSMFLG